MSSDGTETLSFDDFAKSVAAELGLPVEIAFPPHAMAVFREAYETMPAGRLKPLTHPPYPRRTGASMAESKHVQHFRKAHLRAGEEVAASATGYGERKSGITRGALIVTTQRVVFCHKGWFGEHVEHFELGKITAVERSAMLWQHKVALSAGSAEIRFTCAAGEADAVKAVCEALDAGRQRAA